MSHQAHILVVDDEAAVRFMLKHALQTEGYQVTLSASAEEALVHLQTTPFDLALVDLKMPGQDGLSLLAQIRASWPQTAVILLTAFASLESAITALRYGALDYLIKPSPIEEIRASVRRGLIYHQAERRQQELISEIIAWAREVNTTSQPPLRPFTLPLPVGGDRTIGNQEQNPDALSLDPEFHTATLRGRTLSLTPTEFSLLAALVAAGGRVVPCRVLAHAVYDKDYPEPEARALLKPHLKRLRRKLQTDPGQPSPLENVRGIGYRWHPAETT